jgi:RNA polymerase sigma-70 factor, ECF subfamily
LFSFFKNINKETSDEQLVAYMLKGNKLAFELLYERYCKKLIFFANKFVFDIQTAEDIVQEVFIKFIQKPELFNNKYKFSTWIFTLTSNTAKNYLRNENTKLKHRLNFIKNETNDFKTPDVNLDTTLLKEQFNKIFDTHSEKEKQVFTKRFTEQKTIATIASELNIPEGSVKSCIYYLLKKHSTFLNYFTNEK